MKFSGTVIHGDAYGRALGYPTANITTDEYLALEQSVEPGVYAGVVTDEDTSHAAAIVISEVDGTPKLEAHLLNFSGDLYGKELTFDVRSFVRPYQEYKTEEGLISAIAEDVIKIRLMLGLQI